VIRSKPNKDEFFAGHICANDLFFRVDFDMVNVLDLRWMSGVSGISGDDRVQVLLKLLEGRQMPVEIESRQVRRVKRC
jgi:hypothetical protein